MINLKDLADDRYRTVLDESYQDDTARQSKLWYFRIPCQHGFISVHGSETLAAWTGSPRMVEKLIAIPEVEVHQRGDSEVRVLFGPDRLDDVASVLKARRKRKISEAERQRLATVGKAHLFPRRTEPLRDAPGHVRTPGR